MSERLLFSLHENGALTESLAQNLRVRLGDLDTRHFPDGESYLRVLNDVTGREVLLLTNLHQPDQRALSAILLADTLRDLGASSVVMLAPYLPYMRQDKQFHPGEGVTSRYFARILSSHIDGLVTVDPHLHRYGTLSEIYTVPTVVVHAARSIADWIARNIRQPVLIGPDSESEQWVAAVAGLAGAPFTVLTKTRHGDRDVEVSVPDVERWRDHTPVLVDDIISSGHTMLETLQHLKALGLKKSVCIGVHAVFGNTTAVQLSTVAARVVTSNSIPHDTNDIDIGALLAEGVQSFWSAR